VGDALDAVSAFLVHQVEHVLLALAIGVASASRLPFGQHFGRNVFNIMVRRLVARVT
jgi:hypothetical protein